MKKRLLLTIGIFAIISNVNIVNAETWTTKTDMPTPRRGHAIGVVNGKIYVIGGTASPSWFSVNEEYDLATDTWTTKTPMPGGPRNSMAIGVVNGKLYVIGGQYPGGVWLDRNEEYDPSADTVGGTPWTTKAPMPTSRDNLAIGVVNNKIYAIGGIKLQGGNWIYYAVNEEYDPVTDTWTTRAPMPTARRGHKIGVVNNKIYVMGGGTGTSALSVNEEYDPSADTIGGTPWIPKAPMPTARTSFAVGVVENRIYTIGGGDGVPAVTTNEMYDPETDFWETKLNMPTERTQFAAGTVNQKIYCIGGLNGSPGNWFYLSTNEEYTPNITGIENDSKSKNLKAESLKLEIYPTVFKDKTVIKYTLSSKHYGKNNNELPTIRIYDATGRIVKDFSGLSSAIDYLLSVTWSGDDDIGRRLPAGIYFVRLTENKFSTVKKSILLK